VSKNVQETPGTSTRHTSGDATDTAAQHPGFGPHASVRLWWKATRPRTLSASIAPLLVGTAAVLPQAFSPMRFVLALAGSIAIQAGTNMLNEHFDHTQGLDQSRERRSDMVVQTGQLPHGALFRGGLVAMAIGALCGLVLVLLTGPVLLLVGLLSLLAGYAYTARPIALGYRALGEVTVFLFMGPVIVAGAAYVQSVNWSTEAFLLSIPVGMLVTAILHVNNIRDMADDLAHGKRTLANLFGRRIATVEYRLLVLGSYGVLIAVVLAGVVPWPALLALATLPAALRLAVQVREEHGVGALDRLMIRTARLHLRFSGLLALGLVLDALRQRL
jgi:1,4-dihydroxy-2-naphthoate octaprenyltransferase